MNRWYTTDITAGREVTIAKIFAEADRRDPGHARTWIALVDGDIHQIGLIQAQAAARGITITILVDLIHVLEYLWKAAWCFHTPRDPAMEDWVTQQGLDILHGRVTAVITRIGQLAEDHPPHPGGEHAKIIRKTLHYLHAKQPYLDYPQALASGWRRCFAGLARMRRRTSSCWPRPGSASAKGSWSGSLPPLPRTRSGSARTSPGTGQPSR